jgi:hypothetical protein
MNQIVMGASLPFILAALIYLVRRGRVGLAWLIWTPGAMILCATWAVVPDLPRLFGMHDLYTKMAHDPRTDIFMWHYTIDRIEQDSPLFLVGFVTMALSLIITAWRVLHRRESEPHSPHEAQPEMNRKDPSQPVNPSC